MPEHIAHFIAYINELPLWARLVIIGLASFIEYILPIFPGDTIVIFAGFLNAFGGLNIIAVSCAVLFGTIFGSWVAYAVGRGISNRTISYRWALRLASSPKVSTFMHWYKKWGYFLVIINRFFFGIRSFFFVAAGMSNLPLIPVLFFGVLSALLFAALLFGLGYVVGDNTELILSYVEHYTIALSVVLVISLFIGAIAWHKKKG